MPYVRGTRSGRASCASPTTTPTTSSSGARTACARPSIVAALEAAAAHGRGGGRGPDPVSRDLGARGREFLERELFDGEYFVQQLEWRGLRAPSPWSSPRRTPSAPTTRPKPMELLQREGPKYQYGKWLSRRTACSAPGWRAVCGVGETLDPDAGREPSARGPPPQPAPRPLCPRQPAALGLRLWQRRRPPALQLAARRAAHPPVRLQRRGLDRHRVPGRLPPDPARMRRGGPRDRAPRVAAATTAAHATPSTRSSAATGTPVRCPATRCSRHCRAPATTRWSACST